MIVRRISFICCFLTLVTVAQAQVQIEAALCDNRINPTGIHTRDIFFSWELASPKNNQIQTAYQLALASTATNLEQQRYDVFNSGKVNSSQSIQVLYKGPRLNAGQQYYWKVRVWSGDQVASEWSAVQTFTTGLFEPADWKQARWIGAEDAPAAARVVPFVHNPMKENDPRIIKNKPAPLLRKTFPASKKIKSAWLFISGLGHYQASLNGQKIGEAFLTPGWTHYDKTVLYNTYDLTSWVKEGTNVLGVVLGNGFYNVSQERYVKGTGSYGSPKMIALLKLQYTDGKEEFVTSDATWKWAPSAISFNNIYGGEDFDATQQQLGWNTIAFNDANWKPAVLTQMPRGILRPEIDDPVKLMDTLEVKESKVLTPTTVVYDFGQNLSGVPLIKVKGKPGQTIKLIPSELLFEDGRVNQADGVTPHFYQYTIGSNEEETWHPQFTYFALRYVQVEGAVANQSSADAPVITGIKLVHNRNSAAANGSFHCSDSLLNRIYRLIDAAVKSNIQSYITDNPQREKLSWQGEQNFMRTSINYMYHMYGMYRSLMQNVKDAQHGNGLVPDIAPEYMQFEGPFVDSPEWGTTGILNLWFLYKFYGDTVSMRNAYPMMRAYAGYLQTKAEGNLLLYGLGDWLDVGKVTPMGFTASAYYFKAIDAMAKMAALLGEKNDAAFYAQLAGAIKKAFNQKFFDSQKKIYATGSQTSMSMPLVLGLVEDQYKKEVLQNLVHNIEQIDSNRLTAGDVGHKFLVRVLFENGYSNVLYNITKREDTPGYAYQLNKGATALVETWHGGASQNQLAMGHIMEWFYEGIAGIRQQESSIAFKNILIQPTVAGDLNEARGRFHSPYGWIETHWKKESASFSIDIKLPVNTSGKTVLPAKPGDRILVNGQVLKNPVIQQNEVHIPLTSGTYQVQVINSGS